MRVIQGKLMTIKAAFLSIFFCFSCAFATDRDVEDEPRPGPMLEDDGLTWHFEMPERLIVIGDLHGDLGIFFKILREHGLVNEAGMWVGGKTQVVLLGDLVDRGRDTRYLLDYVIRLEQQALQSGGRIHTLLGNHELAVARGEFNYVLEKEMAAFRGYRAENGIKDLIGAPVIPGKYSWELEAHVPHSEKHLDWWAALSHRYGAWYKSRQTMIQIGPYLLVHGAALPWMADQKNSIAQLNATVRGWLKYYLSPNQEPRPSSYSNSQWLFEMNDEASPLWSRLMAEEKLSADQVKKILNAFDADALFLGHTVQSKAKTIYSNIW